VTSGESLYGLLAEFDEPNALVEAARRASAEGYSLMEAYTPFHIEELSEVIRSRAHLVPWIVLGGGVIGAVGAFYMMYYASVISYPLNIGGRPLNSWPAFIPITFELTVLAASFAAVIGMLALNGLPRPHHPLFKATRFNLATQSRLFLCIEAADPRFDEGTTRRLLENLGAREVTEVWD
jgi:hypothetical protein